MSRSTADTEEEKARLRRALRDRLARTARVDSVAASAKIARRVRRLRVWQDAESIALFASVAGEVDTEGLIASVIEEGRRLLLPRIRPGRRLEFAACADPAELIAGPLGIREPAARSPAIPLGGGTLVCVPGLGFDRSGGRIGRGAGYYDRALARGASAGRTPVLLGLAFALQLVDRVPMTSLDVRVDGVVTEDEAWGVGLPRAEP